MTDDTRCTHVSKSGKRCSRATGHRGRHSALEPIERRAVDVPVTVERRKRPRPTVTSHTISADDAPRYEAPRFDWEAEAKRVADEHFNFPCVLPDLPADPPITITEPMPGHGEIVVTLPHGTSPDVVADAIKQVIGWPKVSGPAILQRAHAAEEKARDALDRAIAAEREAAAYRATLLQLARLVESPNGDFMGALREIQKQFADVLASEKASKPNE